MRYVLLVSFTSCIPLDAVVSPSDIEPSSELSEQQLTLDIDTEPKNGFGTELMTGCHLIFDGGLTLKRPMVLGSQNNPVEEEFSDFLRPDRSWGFGATLAPSNEDVQKYFFGMQKSYHRHFFPFSRKSHQNRHQHFSRFLIFFGPRHF